MAHFAKIDSNNKVETVIVAPDQAYVASLGGKLEGNVSSERIDIKKTANIEGVLNQKTLSIEEGAHLKIKTETYK